jgi:hypothetical protein
MNFNDFQKKLKNIRYRTEKEWEIFLPFSTSTETIQKIITICRNDMLINWHLKILDSTEEIPEPELKMYWGSREGN